MSFVSHRRVIGTAPGRPFRALGSAMGYVMGYVMGIATRYAATYVVVSTVLCATVGIGEARAQGVPPATTTAPALPRRIVPGDTSLRGARLRADTLVYALTGFRDGDEIPVGTITDILAREEGDAPRLRRTMSVQRGQSRLLDSTVTDMQTLAPRMHFSVQPQRQLRIEFTGSRVRGTIGPVDAPGVAIDTTLRSPVFDSGNWDLVVRAMPLAPGFAAVFRVYDLETGMHDYIVRVIGSTPMHGEPAHIVLFQLGGQMEITVWIGETTRRLLQVETPLGPTTILRQTLRGPR